MKTQGEDDRLQAKECLRLPEAGSGKSSGLGREHGPAKTLILNPWPPELQDNKSGLLQATWFLELRLGSPRKSVSPGREAASRYLSVVSLTHMLPTSNAGEPTDHKVKTVPPDTGVSFYLLEHLARVLTYRNSMQSCKRSQDFSRAAPWGQHFPDTELQESGCKSGLCHRLRKCPTTHVPPFSSLCIRIIIVLGSKVFARVKLRNTRDVLHPAPNKRPQNPTSQTGKPKLRESK